MISVIANVRVIYRWFNGRNHRTALQTLDLNFKIGLRTLQISTPSLSRLHLKICTASMFSKLAPDSITASIPTSFLAGSCQQNLD